jgi:hypothetical protein
MNCGVSAKEAQWHEKGCSILLIQVNVPLGWNIMVYLGCRALRTIEACRLRFVMVTLATHRDEVNSASLGPRRNYRGGECAPSDPTNKFPVSVVPSSNVAVTMLSSVVSTDFKRLP